MTLVWEDRAVPLRHLLLTLRLPLLRATARIGVNAMTMADISHPKKLGTSLDYMEEMMGSAPT
jgi:hypothetical protein